MIVRRTGQPRPTNQLQQVTLYEEYTENLSYHHILYFHTMNQLVNSLVGPIVGEPAVDRRSGRALPPRRSRSMRQLSSDVVGDQRALRCHRSRLRARSRSLAGDGHVVDSESQQCTRGSAGDRMFTIRDARDETLPRRSASNSGPSSGKDVLVQNEHSS